MSLIDPRVSSKHEGLVALTSLSQFPLSVSLLPSRLFSLLCLLLGFLGKLLLFLTGLGWWRWGCIPGCGRKVVDDGHGEFVADKAGEWVVYVAVADLIGL